MGDGVKKLYFWILTLITTAFVIGLALLKINEVCNNSLFLIPTEYQKFVDYAVDYGAMTLLCMFAFGGLAGRVIRFIIIGILVIVLIIFIIAAAAPTWLQSIFGGGQTASFLLNL
ncbi:MAG: hypothetical protein J6Q51_02955 [Clostridia bacterium]|nr:hypothetical protein [Clostridia bacterium]